MFLTYFRQNFIKNPMKICCKISTIIRQKFLEDHVRQKSLEDESVKNPLKTESVKNPLKTESVKNPLKKTLENPF